MTKAPVKDMKEGLSSARKPDLTHVRTPFMVYTSRNCDYGNFKYERANYLRPVSPNGYSGRPTREDFERYRAYLRAAFSHLAQTLDALEHHQSTDPQLEDVDGMTDAAYAVDVDPDTSGKVGPSFLPHLGGTCASLNMAITQAVRCGLLPTDPGQPWRDASCASPAAERARDVWRAQESEKTARALVDARVAAGAYDIVELEPTQEAIDAWLTGDKK
jgi:hypothetical protein